MVLEDGIADDAESDDILGEQMEEEEGCVAMKRELDKRESFGAAA